MNNIRSNEIINNINISGEMKNNLYQSCVSKKHSSLVTFVYSKQIAAAICAFAVIMTGVSVSAAVINWRERIQSIPEEKIEEYVELANLSNDGETYSRTYTKTELSRVQELLEEYHNGRYPESEITVVDTLAEIPAGTVCYVKETGIIYFPAEEMTDEQLLQIIDYEEKSQYSLMGEILDKPEDFQEGIAVEDTERAKQLAASDSYCVSFSSDELSSWVSGALIYCDTWEVYMVSHSGWGKYYEAVGKDEAYARADEFSAAAQEYISTHFTDTGALKSVRFKSDIYGEEETTESVAIFLEYEQLCIRIDLSTYDDSIDTFITWSDREEFEDTINALMNGFGYEITTLQ